MPDAAAFGARYAKVRRWVHTYPAPPRGFDPLSATNVQLAEYGLPERPDAPKESARFRFWEEMLKPPTDFVVPDFASVERRQLAFARHGSDPKRRASILARGSAGHLGDSRNWSGACIIPARPNRFFYVAGAWCVPEPTIPRVAPNDADPVDPEYRCSTWIGIGGHRPYNTLPQIGTSQHISLVNGTLTTDLGAWWQWWVRDRPEHHVPYPIPITVEVGDRILAELTVEAPAPGDVHFRIKNQRTGEFATFKVIAPANIVALGATAEWIHERPTKFDSRDMYPMPKCSDVEFEYCLAKSAPAFGAPETVQELLNPRLIRMYEDFGAPHRSAFVSLPERLGPSSLRISYREAGA